MLWKIDFIKNDKPPSNYIPGLSRGDKGFITSYSNGPINKSTHKLISDVIDKSRINNNKIDKSITIDIL